MHTNQKYKSDWNAYWQSGLNTSCIPDNKDDFPHAIKAFWAKQATPLLKNNNKVIDLCSGAGGIPKLLINSLKPKLKITCLSTDYTTHQRDSTLLNSSTIDYLSNCNCESLPFEKNSFNCITSSFGFEYSQTNKTLNQINRVIKSSGIFAAVIHTENSAVVANSRKQIKQADFLMKELNYFDIFKHIFLKQRIGKSFQKKAEMKFRNSLEKIKLKTLMSTNSHIYKQILESSESVFNYSRTHSITATVNQINLQEKSLVQNQNRMKNLINIVNDEKNIHAVQNFFKNNNYTTLYNKEIINNNQCVGFGLIVKKC